MAIFQRKKEQTEFRGVSVSNEKRNAVIIFTVEAIIIIFVVVGIFLALKYFGIFPLPKTNTVFLEEEKTGDIVVPAQRGYGPGDDSSQWKPLPNQ